MLAGCIYQIEGLQSTGQASLSLTGGQAELLHLACWQLAVIRMLQW